MLLPLHRQLINIQETGGRTQQQGTQFSETLSTQCAHSAACKPTHLQGTAACLPHPNPLCARGCSEHGIEAAMAALLGMPSSNLPWKDQASSMMLAYTDASVTQMLPKPADKSSHVRDASI